MTPEEYGTWLEEGGHKLPDTQGDVAVEWFRSIDDRAAELLPNVAPALRFKVLHGLLNAANDDQRYVALERAALRAGVDLAYALAHADIPADLFDVEPGFREWDETLQATDPLKVTDVVGAIDLAAWGTAQVGMCSPGEYLRMSPAELVERANAWMRFASPDGEVIPLLGTELRSWEEVTPSLTAANVHHMGDSATTEARKARTYPVRLKVATPSPRVTDHRAVKVKSDPTIKTERGYLADGTRVTIQRPDTTAYVASCCVESGRVVKCYASRDRVRTGTTETGLPIFATRTIVGHGKWSVLKLRKPRKGQSARVNVVPTAIADVAELLAQAETFAVKAIADRLPARVAWSLPSGVVVRISAESSRFRLTIDGTRVTVRKVAHLQAAISNRVH